MSTGVTVFAPAKINLYLEIVGRRDDGYHLLDSTFAFADVGDVVHLTRGTSKFRVSGPFADALAECEAMDNLVLRAVQAYQSAIGVSDDLALHLTKNLPVASGIGGGSADAAATLLGLNEIYESAMDGEALASLALSLGADVPACLADRPVHVAGVGEIITPIEAAREAIPAVLINPGIAVSTPAVFRAYREMGPSFHAPQAAPRSLTLANISKRSNDLEMPAQRICPVITEVLVALQVLPGALMTRMSGSGATCFALFQDMAIAKQAADALSKAHPNWWVCATALGGVRERFASCD